MTATRVMRPTVGATSSGTHVVRGQGLDRFGHDDVVSDPAGRRSAASALLLTRLGAERGVPPATTLAGTGLEVETLRVPGTEVTGGQELALIGNLQRACPDADLALAAGSRYHLTTYGIWGFALASSPTVRDALAVGSTFVDLSFTFCSLQVEQDAGELRLCLLDDGVPDDVRAFVVTRDLTGLRTLAGELAPGLALPRLTVRLPEPPDLAPWAEVFGVVPEFDAARNVAVLDAAALDLPLPQADELTAAVTQQQCRELVERRRTRLGVAGAVRDELVRTPGDMPSLEQLADRLAVSSRTLRRRLTEEKTSFRALVDEVRAALAEELLSTGSLTVEQVAGRLGYAETASFTHAFTRWKGVSPRAWVRGRADRAGSSASVPSS
jgi:AraC-like DNA-binding protein